MFGPPGVVARRAQQVPDDKAVPERDSSGGPIAGPQGLDLGAKVDLLAQQRLHRAVPDVALLKEPRGRLDVLVGEGLNVESAHRRRTIPLTP